MVILQHHEVVDSTNALLRRLAPVADMAVYADCQTAGRGQRGNVWLSAPGQNLLFSLLWHPASELPARLQFAVSQAVALGVRALLADCGVRAKVKWPNDIYVADRKICGILIENAVGAALLHSIIGIGLNVNQSEFDALLPNPVSIHSLTGRKYEIGGLARSLVERLYEYLPLSETEEGRAELHRLYLEALYRADGREHLFRDVTRSEIIRARVAGVEPAGFLLLQVAGEPEPRRFAFKEVEYLLPPVK